MIEIKYVCGFAFNEEKTKVVLIHKTKGPPSVIGKLNGVGGKMELTDLCSHDAMTREFREETGLFVRSGLWTNFATLVDKHRTWSVEFFKCFLSDETINMVKTMEEEIIVITHLFNFSQREDIVPNLSYLIPLALHKDNPYASIVE